ncbi:unnamed protein product [Arabidopsis lyrata]|nr:unnamed protein product [Arabidopsis lyrata]
MFLILESPLSVSSLLLFPRSVAIFTSLLVNLTLF